MPNAQRHTSLPAIVAAFTLAAVAACAGRPAEAHVGYYSNAELESPQDLNTDSHSIIRLMMEKYETNPHTKCVDDDNGHGVSCWGIVASANGLTEQQDRNLTEDDAELIYKRNYWDKIGGDNLVPTIRHLVFNDAIQFGPGTTLKMMARANNDPYVLLQENAIYYERLGNNLRYQGSLKGWHDRQDRLLRLQNRLSSANVEIAENTQNAAPTIIPAAAQAVQAPAEATQVASVTEPSHTPAEKSPGMLWSIFMMSAIRRRRNGATVLPPIEIDTDEPMINLEPIKKLFNHIIGHDSDIGAADDQLAFGPLARASGVSSPHALGAFEREAFWKIFEARNKQQHTVPHTWHVDYDDQSHVVIERGRVHLHGDGGIEDALRYAALAWGKQCTLSGGSPEQRGKIKDAAQRLVDAGDIAEGFTIAGLGTFSKTAQPLEDSYPMPPFVNSAERAPAWPMAANG